MSWGKLDDSMAFHRKVLAAGNEAVGAWARMISQSCCELTDGRIARATALAITSPKVLKRLVEVGLLEALPSGDFQLHDFLDWNPSAEEVKTKRERDIAQRKAAGIRGAEARWGRKNGEPDGEPPSSLPSRTHGGSPSRSTSASDGSRPVPSRPDPEEERSPLPPAVDSNPEWGLEPERASAVQPIADEPADAPPAAGVTPRQLEYQRAYESGIAAGKGAPYAMPEPQRAELHRAIATFAKDRAGKAYRGDVVLRWIAHTAREFAQQVRGREATYYSSFGPRGFVKWLNEAEVDDGAEAGHGG